MHTWRQVLLLRDAAQQAAERLPLREGERGADSLIVFSSNPANGVQNLTAFASQMERVDTTILGTVAPLDQPPLLQFVEESNEPARRETEHCRQRLLADPGARVNQAQHSCVRRGEVQMDQPSGKRRGGVCTNLGEQKRGRLRRPGGSCHVAPIIA